MGVGVGEGGGEQVGGPGIPGSRARPGSGETVFPKNERPGTGRVRGKKCFQKIEKPGAGRVRRKKFSHQSRESRNRGSKGPQGVNKQGVNRGEREG